MKKKILCLIIVIITLFACKNKSHIMIEYKNYDATLCFGVPSYMYKIKEDNNSMLFEGDEKFVNYMWNKAEYGWDIDKFSQNLTQGNNDLTLVEKNDTLIVYEIHKGTITIPALTFSLQERNGYSILVTTMGISLANHLNITNSIK